MKNTIIHFILLNICINNQNHFHLYFFHQEQTQLILLHYLSLSSLQYDLIFHPYEVPEIFSYTLNNLIFWTTLFRNKYNPFQHVLEYFF